MYELWQRFSSELMVLGFISFLSWALEQGEAFKDISTDLSHDYTNYPDELSLVHTIHAVHQWIFIAMMIHFATSLAVVAYVVHENQRKMAKYERWVHMCYKAGDEGWKERTANFSSDIVGTVDIASGERYVKVRSRFIQYCKDNGEEHLIGGTKHGSKQYSVDDSFVFSLYSTLNQDRVLADFYHFHPASWGLLLILKVIEALILYGTLDTHNYQWGYEFGCDLFLATIGIIVGLFLIRLMWKLSEKNMSGDEFSTDGMCKCLFHSFCTFDNDQSTDLWIGRVFQAFSFTLAYEIASSMGDKNFWDAVDIDHYPMSASEYHAIYCVMLLVCWPLFAFILTKVLISICLDFSLPPYLDKDHWRLVKTTIKAGALVHGYWQDKFDGDGRLSTREDKPPCVDNLPSSSGLASLDELEVTVDGK